MQILSLLDQNTLRILTVFIFAFLAWLLLQIFTKAIVLGLSSGTPRGRRLGTLSSVVRTVGSTIIFAVAVFEILGMVGFDLAPLLASAGVVGLAVGFGAQTLVKDVITGILLLMEDQFDQGDDVQIGDKRGIVERLTLRTVWLREKGGALHIIPSGSIVSVTNYSKK